MLGAVNCTAELTASLSAAGHEAVSLRHGSRELSSGMAKTPNKPSILDGFCTDLVFNEFQSHVAGK